MFEQFLQLSGLSARVLPYVLLCLMLLKVNLSKQHRYRQLLMIPLALAYSGILLHNIEGLTSRVYGLIRLFEKTFPILGAIDWNYWTLLASNLLVLALYIAFKGAVLPLVNLVWGLLERFFKERVGVFYFWDPEEQAFFLKNRWGQFKGLYRAFYYGLTVYSTLMLITAYRFRSLSCFSYRFYPVYGVIVFGEIVSYLNGFTRKEYEDQVPEEKKEAHKNDYEGLREEYLQLFGSKIITDEVSTRTLPENDPVADQIARMKASGENALQAYGEYLQRERDLGKELRADYIQSAAGMLQGRSILFANPFYRDMGSSIFFPFNMALLRHQCGLVIIGRDGIEDEITGWVEEGLEEVSHVPGFWRIGPIGEAAGTDIDIGILSLKDMNNLTILRRYRGFFANVGFVLMLEPSRIVTMNQLALSILSYMIGSECGQVVYCSCDKNTDGAVDALSHILRTSITEVGATIPSSAKTTTLGWSIDDPFIEHRLYPNIVRYLGGGISVASVALKHGIDHVTWYSDHNMPVKDVRWIAGQYFDPIAQYIGSPSSQEVVDDHFAFSSSLWGAGQSEDTCLIVEDEYNNLFEMSRQFATRATKETFLNVFAPAYLLRDYMCANPTIFEADPKAIPQVVADFARTRRNSAMQLIMVLISGPTSDLQISQLLSAAQIVDPVTRDFLDSLIGEFYDIAGYGSVVREAAPKDEYDPATQSIITRHYFTITNERFISAYASELRTAYYLAEDDESNVHFLGGRLKGQVYQAFLPGQFVTLAGKYYEVVGIQNRADIGVDVMVVRRAADHITSRRSYRQLKEFSIDKDSWDTDQTYRSSRSGGRFAVSSGYLDMTVRSTGFLEMESYNDLAHASRHEIRTIPERVYLNKYAIRIELPEATAQVRGQIALMMNEVFRTMFPECCEYISAVTNADGCEELFEKTAMPGLAGNARSDVIYILEDSQIDLGLTISVERYLDKILQIICDYAEWSLEELSPNAEQPDPEEIDVTDDLTDAAGKYGKKKGWLRRLIEWLKKHIGSLFKRKKPEEEPEGADEPSGADNTDGAVGADGTGSDDTAGEAGSDDTDGATGADDTAGEAGSDDTDGAAETDNSSGEAGTDEPSNGNSLSSLYDPTTGSTFDGEEETDTQRVDPGDTAEAVSPGTPKHYMFYGNEELPSYVDLAAVHDYLVELGLGDNPFKKVRKGLDVIEEIEKTYHPEDKSRVFCDFCCSDITEVSYDVLSDGRCRCARCSATAVKSIDEFSDIFLDVRGEMERRFGIQMRMPIKVKMVSAKTLSKVSKHRFTASSGFDPRCVGLAVSNRGGYTLYVENGSPEENTRETIAHELTHIWQYTNWSDSSLEKRYGSNASLLLYEGMAVWTSIRFMMITGHVAYAKRLEMSTRLRDDEYGKGYLLYEKKYGEPETPNLKQTPFMYPEEPL